MPGQGTAVIDFGVFPGSADASVAVAAAGITGTSLVEAWLYPVATADHSADEHIVDPPRVVAGAPVAGVGFTVYGFSMDTRLHHGRYTVGWVWN